MTLPFGGPLSQEAVSLLALEAGFRAGQTHAAGGLASVRRRDIVDEDYDWETALIDLGGEG